VSDPDRKIQRPWWWGNAGPLTPQAEYLLYGLLLLVVLFGALFDEPLSHRIRYGILAFAIVAWVVYLVVIRRRRTTRAASK
jgi:hypothetical protein